MIQGLEFDDFEKALSTLGVVAKTDKKTLHKLYLSLSKEFHPDACGGNTGKFQEINDAYRLIMHYIDNYRFDFDMEEFKKQYPFSKGDWLCGR